MDKLTPFATDIIQEKSNAIEKETKAMLASFHTLKFTEHSEASEVIVTLNGNYEVLEVQCESPTSNFDALLTEALNHAFKLIEFELTSRLDGIDYLFFGEAITAIEKPGQVNDKFKKNLSRAKKH